MLYIGLNGKIGLIGTNKLYGQPKYIQALYPALENADRYNAIFFS